MIDAMSTKGDEIRKENVTPNGSPAVVKPMNSGIEEQEQNGLTVPSSAPRIFAPTPDRPPRIRRVRSGDPGYRQRSAPARWKVSFHPVMWPWFGS